MREEIVAKAMELSREKEGPVALALTPEEAAAFRGEKEGEFISVLALANVGGVPAYLGRDVPVEDGMDVDAITSLAMRAAINVLSEKLRLLHAEAAGSA